MAHIAGDTQNGIENAERIGFSGTGAPRWISAMAPENNVQTNT